MSSSKKPISLFSTRITPGLWAQFYHWYEVRKEDHRPVYPRSEHGIWIVKEADGPIVVNDKGDTVDGPELVAGCCVYPADGPYAIAEFVSTNPALPKKLLHFAIAMVCQGMSHYGSFSGKTVVCFPKHKGVKRMMEKAGYNYTKPTVQVMYPPFYAPVGVYGREQTSPAATMDTADAAE